MKLKKWIKVACVVVGIVAISACSSKHKGAVNQSSINDANDAYNAAQSSGVNDDSHFGYQGRGQRVSANTYYFDFDKSNVREQDKPAILAHADKLNRDGGKIMLEGNTDPRGSREYNIGLGERRAKAVANIMAAKGVRPNQIRVVSYGSEKLASNGHNEQDYQLDRRAVIVNVKH